MNLKRIIREELEAVLDSFYLLVSEDEKFPMTESEGDEWGWAREVELNPFYEEGIALQIDVKPTLEQAEMVFEWLVQAGKTTAQDNKTHDRAKRLTERASLYTYIVGFKGSDWLWHVGDKNYSLFVSKGKIHKLIKLSDIFPKKQEQLKEESEVDEWEWARETKPIELENPEDWVGRSFGYGPELISKMNDIERERGDDKIYYTIIGVGYNDTLILVRYHPLHGENHDNHTSPRNLRDYINKGLWVWK